MRTPYGLLPGTNRTTRRGKFECHVVEFIGPDNVKVQWHDTLGGESVVSCKDLDLLPQANNPPHGLNWGTLRTLKDGGACRVERYVNCALVSVQHIGDGSRVWARPSHLEPITE